MATVADLVTLLNVKLIGFQDALAPAGTTPATENLARKISVLNESYHTVWRVLVGIEKEFESYWFTKRVSNLSAGSGLTRDFNLPADFHDMLYLEVVSPDASRVVRFERAGFNTQRFISERQETANISPDTLPSDKIIHYVTARGNPSRLHLGRSFASGTTLGYVYTYSLDNLEDDEDEIDDLMTPYQGVVTSCAAAVLLNAVHESGLAQSWEARYDRDVASMRGAAAEGRPPSEGLRKELA